MISDELCFAHHSQLVAEPVAAGSQLIELEPEVVVPVALRDQVLLGLLYLRPQLVKETGKPVLVDLFRCKFNPVGTLAMIHEEYGNLPLTGSVLYDPLNAGDPMLGGYGRYIEKKAA
ncbi:hypothetical protein [Pseudomonas aeruginosa]|uniref:hypothetical protein n=1 Tax=Pseudomonas aeruginosa TaxID=287 RepID=UPI001FCDA2C8|nr:hypothetical protein [Pseudomonas aeruginosa]